MAICLLLPAVPQDVAAQQTLRVGLVPVVAPGHPLAKLGRPASRGDLEPHVQLVLSDPEAPESGNYGLSSARLWQFVDLGRRMDFLLAGFGWCRMPEHLVADAVAAGDLAVIAIGDDPTPQEGLTIHATYRRDRALGLAGRWLVGDFRRRLSP